jgi:hypothetical protein
MPADGILIGDQGLPDTDNPIEEAPEAPEQEEPETLLAGKFKNVGDLEKSYSELSSKIGEQGNRLGEMEKDKSFLMNQLEGLQAKNQEAPIDQGKADDFDAQLGLISKQVEDGDLSIGEGMQQTAKISAQMAQTETVKGLKQEQDAATIEHSKRTFADSNPDFFEMQQAGVLDEVKGKLPGFHDDISAYYAIKAEQATASVESARAEGVELGKAEMAKIAGGDSNTQKVLQGGGKSAESIGRKAGPMKPNEIRDSGMAALQKARGS